MNESSAPVVIDLVCAMLALGCRRLRAPASVANAPMLVILCVNIVQVTRGDHVVATLLGCALVAALSWWAVHGLGVLVRNRERIGHALGRCLRPMWRMFR